MAKTWKQILDEMGKVPPEQTRKDEQEMLAEKRMTYAEFTGTAEWKEIALHNMRRFSDPGIRVDTKE